MLVNSYKISSHFLSFLKERFWEKCFHASCREFVLVKKVEHRMIENIYKSYLKRHTCKIYEELLQLNNKKIIQLKNGQDKMNNQKIKKNDSIYNGIKKNKML